MIKASLILSKNKVWRNNETKNQKSEKNNMIRKSQRQHPQNQRRLTTTESTTSTNSDNNKMNATRNMKKKANTKKKTQKTKTKKLKTTMKKKKNSSKTKKVKTSKTPKKKKLKLTKTKNAKATTVASTNTYQSKPQSMARAYHDVAADYDYGYGYSTSGAADAFYHEHDDEGDNHHHHEDGEEHETESSEDYDYDYEEESHSHDHKYYDDHSQFMFTDNPQFDHIGKYEYDRGSCPYKGKTGLPCAPRKINEVCDKYDRHDEGSFKDCLDICKPSFCCIHDAKNNDYAKSCSQDENCAQYAPCYIVWWKLHDTVGPALYLKLEQNDDFFDVDDDKHIKEDASAEDFFEELLLHHFDDIDEIIEKDGLDEDGEFEPALIFDNAEYW